MNWAGRFKSWFIAGVLLGILNFIIYTSDTAAKLKRNKKAHGMCQLAGCCTFALSIGHVIWIAVLRFRKQGKIVSGSYLTEELIEIEEVRDNYLIAHGKFALWYLILTGIIFGFIILVGLCLLTYACVLLNSKDE